MATGASGTVIEVEYRGETIHEEARFEIDGPQLHLGMTEPDLVAPIDYEAEIARRCETHEPHVDVGGNIGNRAFGI